MIRVASHLVAVLLTSGHAAAQTCNQAPPAFATQVFDQIESARDDAQLSAVYGAYFSRNLKAQLPEMQFKGAARMVISQLGTAGVPTTRRMIAEPYLIPAPPGTVGVNIVTNSRAGKVFQTVYLRCTGSDWKVEGIWYSPAPY